MRPIILLVSIIARKRHTYPWVSKSNYNKKIHIFPHFDYILSKQINDQSQVARMTSIVVCIIICRLMIEHKRTL